MNIGYLISSAQHYVEAEPISKLIDSLLRCGISKDNIQVHVGQSEEIYSKIVNGIEYYFLDCCAFDNNCMVSLVENNITKYDRVFLLHDTCEAGPMFEEYTRTRFNPNTDATVLGPHPMPPGSSTALIGWCGLGMYSLEFVQKMSDFYIKHRTVTKDYGIDGGSAVRCCLGWYNEIRMAGDSYLGRCSVDTYPDTLPFETTGPTKVYDGADRITEYYAGIDLYKYKANWGAGAWVEIP